MAYSIKKILVPIDFSDVSFNALEYAAFCARELDAQVTLLHVVESYEYNVALGEEESTDIISKGIETKLEELVKEKKMEDIKVDTLQKQGKIYQVINDVAQDGEYDLIIMGTHGATGISDFKRYMLGTNAYRVVLSAHCPVITIKGEREPKEGFKNILLPLDITKETQQKVELSIHLAKIFGSTIYAVSVSRFIDEFVVAIEKLKKQLRQVAQRIRNEGIECHTRMIRHSNIAESVLDYADEVDADLIMIMTQQERKWNEFLLGSSARTIVTHAKRPVLSLRPEAAGTNEDD